MRDPRQNVTFVFKCYEKESIDLKIRLRYDGLQQTEFFREILDMYVNQHPVMNNIVAIIKERRKTMGKKKIKNSVKDLQEGAKVLERLGLTDSDRSEIFDLIEGSIENE